MGMDMCILSYLMRTRLASFLPRDQLCFHSLRAVRSSRMVFFICNACGETLKKNMVDKHSWSCKSCWKLACMDCGKEFEGEAYKEHMSCMSEAQRYEGKLYQPKENKGEVKQQAWTEGVQQRLQSAPGTAA